MPLSRTLAAYGLSSLGTYTVESNTLTGRTGTPTTELALTAADIGYKASFYITAAASAITVDLEDSLTAGETAGVASTGVFTLADLPAAAETVTLGASVYTWRASVSTAFDVLIGATASDCLDNLLAAITAGTGSGSLYGAGTTANASATAEAGTGDTLDVEALATGTSGDAIPTTSTTSNGTWGETTLTGGVDEVTLDGADGTDDLGGTTATAVAISGILVTLASGAATVSIPDMITAEITAPGGIQLWAANGDANLVDVLTITATADDTQGTITIRGKSA
jgi:hypothetical protein